MEKTSEKYTRNIQPVPPSILTDFYKFCHVFQYPEGTEYVYSNLTARKSRMSGVNKVVWFGLQHFIIKYLMNYFQKHFFQRPKKEVLAEYKRFCGNTIGPLKSYEHISKLHDLGYLPLRIKALPEGTRVPIRVPMLTITNTKKEFYWLTNFVETLMSCELWQPLTSATVAYEYRKLLDRWAKLTGVPTDFVDWQGHDFSFRGMSSKDSAVLSGMGHLLSFTGTDTAPAIWDIEQYYGADISNYLVGASVNATEHAVMCAGGKEAEFETFKRLITKVHPTGILSIVSDTWDLWKVITEFLPKLKPEIMARDGKVVIRPDSGDPVDIVAGLNTTDEYLVGDKSFKQYSKAEIKGAYESLWDIFGGAVDAHGNKQLDPHIGLIYGDAITLDRAAEISRRLHLKQFGTSTVFGIGSFTYQYNTRDTFGLAVKATLTQRKGIQYPIFKDPVTDDGTKKSAVGYIQVGRNNYGEIYYKDRVTKKEEENSMLRTVFEDGQLIVECSYDEIRHNLKNSV